MKRIKVDSTTVQSIGYNARNHELDLEFLETGDVYRYFDVSAMEYAEFMAAKSKGTYLNQVFKPKNHRYVLIKKGNR